MKRRMRVLSLILSMVILCLAGCSSKDKDDTPTSANGDAEQGQGMFWESNITDDTIAVIVNKFTDKQYKSIGETTKLVLDDSKEKILLVSAGDNTNIEVWSVDYVDDKLVEKELKYEMKAAKKNAVVEMQVTRAESIPAYKIKLSNSKGNLEYLLTYDGKDGTPDIEYLTIEIKDTANGSATDNNTSGNSSNIEKELSIGIFIPDGSYEIKYDASDLISNDNYVKGNGTTYQVVGTSGKGPYINVYELKDNGIYKVYNGDLTSDEMSAIETIDYLDKRNNNEEAMILNAPIKVGTRWDNKEIVEVGENLKLGSLSLEGAYVKTWEKETSNGQEVVKVYYYSEGLGCVQHRVLLGEEVVEYSIATEVIKK